MTPEMITKITEALITVLLALVSAYVIPWLKNKVGEDKYATVVEFAEIVVRSAEKLYTAEEWERKKEYAVYMVSQKSEELGLKLGTREINAIIEGAVQAVKG